MVYYKVRAIAFALFLFRKEIIMGASVIPLWREGVLKFKGEPRYIVRQTDFPSGESVVGVYNVSKETYKESNGKMIVKDWSYEQKPSEFRGETPLAEIARKKEKKVMQRREKPALYTSRVMNGISTFGGKEGLGFYEYTPERYNPIKHGYEQSEKTGVFILLDDIKWLNELHMDNKELMKLLTEVPKETWEGFYEL